MEQHPREINRAHHAMEPMNGLKTHRSVCRRFAKEPHRNKTQHPGQQERNHVSTIGPTRLFGAEESEE